MKMFGIKSKAAGKALTVLLCAGILLGMSGCGRITDKKIDELEDDGYFVEQIDNNSICITEDGIEYYFKTGLIKPVLDKLSETLAGVKNYVHVRGYTDNRYLGDELYKSSWELSSARAISVLNYFADKGVEQQRMAVEAYGEFSPSASNSTKRGREKNRKVVIAVSKYAYNPKPLPIIEDDDVKVNDGNNGKGKSDFKPENYNLIRLPDGTIQLKNKEK